MWFRKKPKKKVDLDDYQALQDQINDLRTCGIESENAVSALQHHQECAALHDGRHPLIFKEACKGGWFTTNTFTFICEDCGLEVCKTQASLSEIERDALIDMGHDYLKSIDEENK